MSRRGLSTDRIRIVLATAACALSAALTFAPPAGAVLVRLPSGHLAGVQFRNGVNPAAVRGALARRPELAPADDTCAIPDIGTVCYQGGPVLHTTAPYLVFWQPSGTTPVPPSSATLLEKYLTDVAADSGETGDTYGVARQYYDTTGFADAGQTFSASKQAIVDDQPYPTQDMTDCPSVTGFTACVTDAQIQTELTRLIAADGLPTGLGPGAPIYFLITPDATNVCLDAGDCADVASPGAFCGYHSNFLDGANQVIYASIPFASEQGGAKGCQDDSTTAPQYPNGDFADTIADNMSHENNESITDPLGTAWYDTESEQEISDNCESYDPIADPPDGDSPDAYEPVLGGDAMPVSPAIYGTFYDQSINGDHYYTQTIWSNGNVGCEAAPNGGTVSSSFTDTAPVLDGTSVSFNPAASNATTGFSSTTWNFGDGTTAFSLGAPAAVAHSYTAPSHYTVSLTLVDTDGDLATISHTIVVGLPPTASFTTAPAHALTGSPVSFNAGGSTDPNSGAAIVAYAWSFGDGGTALGATRSHVYAKPGVYTVRLAVADSLGFSATKSASLTVVAPGRITKLSVKKFKGKEFLVISVSAAGTVRIGSRSTRLRRAGKASFKLGSAPKKHHKLSVKVTVVYVPQAGPEVKVKFAKVFKG